MRHPGPRVWRPKGTPIEPVDTFASDGDDAETGLFSFLRDRGAAVLEHAVDNFDTDRVLLKATAAAIEIAASRYALDAGATWTPGSPLKVLLAGYNGTRNTGADVRVEEMIRQFRHIFGDEQIELSVQTFDPELTRGYFRTVRQLHMPKIFPKFLFDTVHDHHAVVACEGSMFKSKFANALSIMMTGALGLAAAEQKIGVAYGGEAGDMDEALEDFVAKHAQDALIICRNRASQSTLGRLGIRSHFGTDTAWTFQPAPAQVGERILKDKGWDGRTPVLALCPINAFWWPVRPNLGRAITQQLSGIYDDTHYGSVYFHHNSPDTERQQERYIKEIARAVRRFRQEHDVFPVMIGSEQLDREACEWLNDELGGKFPVIVSDEYDMYQMVSVIRSARMMLSSRYHAIVTTMPAGVPSAGVTMDERIRNLMAERGQPHLAIGVDDDDLANRCHDALVQLWQNPDEIRSGIYSCVATNLERMAQMGALLVDHVRAAHPEFPFRDNLGTAGDLWEHLPPLSPALQEILEAHR